MLNFVRKHASSWIIKILLGIIVLVFVAWGGYSYKSLRADRLARVGDQYVTQDEYRKAYNFMVESYRRQFGKAFSEELLQQLNLKEQALNMLVERIVISQAAKELGLEASTDEVQRKIMKYPAFQRDGKFNQEAYTLALRQARMTPTEFESQTMDDLTIQNVQEFIRRRANVTDDEALGYAYFNNALFKIGYVTFDGKDFEDQATMDDKAIAAFYEERKELYRAPEKRRFSVTVFKPESYTDGVVATEKEISDYYEDHQDKFHKDAQVKASHILFRVEQDAPEADAAKAKAEAEKVLEEARKPDADFAELARKYSQDPTAAQNAGELGYFTRAQMTPAFAAAAFTMQPGQISDLVRTPFGFHIIKLEDAKPAETQPLEAVRNDIVEAVKREKARQIAYDRARDFADEAFADRDLKKSAQDKKLAVVGTDVWVAPKDPIPGISPSPDASEALFGLPEKGVSNVIETPQGFLVAQVEEIREAYIPPLEEVKDRVQKDFRVEEGRKLAREKAVAFIEAAKKANGILTVAQEQGLLVKTTDWISRKSPDKDLRLREDAMEQIFELQESSPLADAPFEMGKQYVAAQLMEKKEPDPNAVATDIAALRIRLLQQKQDEIWEAWIAEQQKKTDIERLQKL
jgi:peptidyl-prolyl cis-trans isomerase D